MIGYKQMEIQVFPSHYKDQAAVTIESEILRAQFLPSVGAKLASLVYKPLNFELLVQRPGAEYRLQPFDGEYVAGECSGYDDMFPTIDLCYYDRHPWSGTKMADHGEVWSLAWEKQVEANSLAFAVHGVRFPYRLEKCVSFTDPQVLRLDYRLINLSAFDFDFVWAGHTMINLEEGTELVLPAGVGRVVQVFNMGGDFGSYGDEYPWPEAVLPGSRPIDFRALRPKSTGEAYKYYIKGKMPAGWCGLKYHRKNFSLALSFPVNRVPYLGVLPNEGGWQDLYNIFLEPCTATFDRPDAARYRGEVSTLKAGQIYAWHLNFTLAEGVGFRSVREDGKLEVEE